MLDLLGPVPQAVANAAKRVFVLAAAVLTTGVGMLYEAIGEGLCACKEPARECKCVLQVTAYLFTS